MRLALVKYVDLTVQVTKLNTLLIDHLISSCL